MVISINRKGFKNFYNNIKHKLIKVKKGCFLEKDIKKGNIYLRLIIK
jgi:hypothetical protein